MGMFNRQKNKPLEEIIEKPIEEPIIVNEKPFTEKEAIVEIAEVLIEYLQKDIIHANSAPRLKEYIDRLERIIVD